MHRHSSGTIAHLRTYGRIDGYLLVATFTLGLASFEWLHVISDLAPMPGITTAFAVPISLYAAFRIFQLGRKARRLKLGRDGERAVGQFLDDKLRPLGYHVLHDVRGGNWNIDHIIVGPNGLFTIETKTRSKPRRGCPVVRYDGESVTVGGWKPDRDPVSQANAQAAWLSETLSRSLGLKLPVQAVVVFPGWFVEASGSQSAGKAWVLSPKALPSFVTNNRASIDARTANTVSHFLRQMVRSG